MLSRGFASCSSAFEELYKRSEVTRKDQGEIVVFPLSLISLCCSSLTTDEKFQKKVELLAEKKQQISRINDEIAQITQKLKENLTVNDREFYQKVNLQEGARLTLIRGVLKDLQTTLAKGTCRYFRNP